MAPQKPKKAAQSIDTRAWEALTPSLSEWILDAVSSMGFDRMTPVQASTIPLFTGNKDVVVEAVTGSGKTLAFLIPIVERLLRLEEPIRKHHIGAIIISPTRELATQIHSVLLSLLSFHSPSALHIDPSSRLDTNDETNQPPPSDALSSSSLKVIPQLLVGGSTPPSQDLAQFLTNSPNLVISTPGRLLELLSSPHVHCPQSSFEVLVLDEADRLLDLGFKDDLQKILQRLPKQRRTGLFSASVSEAVDQLVRVGLRNPVRIAVKVKGKDGVEDRRTPASLKMTYLTTPPTLKLPQLLNLIFNIDPPPQRTIAYLSTCAAVDYFSHVMRDLLPLIGKSPHDLSIVPLHGRQTAPHRNVNLAKFTDSAEPSLLLTTDLASRGLDIPLVDLTVQLDPPSDPKTFLHRAGRAGRAGRRGLAVVFLTPGRESEDYPPFLTVRKTPVEPLAETQAIPSLHSPSIRSNPITNTEGDDAKTQAQSFTSAIRAAVRRDRALHDKAQRAFVSFVRSYSKHAASSIFRVKELDWRDLAEAWGLLRLPRMPELRQSRNAPKKSANKDDADADIKVEEEEGEQETKGREEEIDRSLGLSIDWATFAYRDKQQEAKRKREMAEQAADPSAFALAKKDAKKGRKGDKSSAWSGKAAVQEAAAARRAKKETRRAAARRGQMSAEEARREEELKGMIAEVRRRNVDEKNGEFEGFPD